MGKNCRVLDSPKIVAEKLQDYLARHPEIESKINKIIENPYHYKSLKYGLAGERRVHIMKSFVLFRNIYKS